MSPSSRPPLCEAKNEPQLSNGAFFTILIGQLPGSLRRRRQPSLELCRCGGLLPPSLFVHSEHEEPQHQRCVSEKTEGCNVGEQSVSERQIQETQPTQPSQYRQHAQNARHEGGPDHKAARQERIESEKYQG